MVHHWHVSDYGDVETAKPFVVQKWSMSCLRMRHCGRCFVLVLRVWSFDAAFLYSSGPWLLGLLTLYVHSSGVPNRTTFYFGVFQ